MCRVYVGNVEGVEKKELESFFDKYGALENVWVARHPPGFAFVTFRNAEDANRAIEEAHKSELGGKTISVEMARNGVRIPSLVLEIRMAVVLAVIALAPIPAEAVADRETTTVVVTTDLALIPEEEEATAVILAPTLALDREDIDTLTTIVAVLALIQRIVSPPLAIIRRRNLVATPHLLLRTRWLLKSRAILDPNLVPLAPPRMLESIQKCKDCIQCFKEASIFTCRTSMNLNE